MTKITPLELETIKELGRNVRAVRLKNSLTQEELARKSGLTVQVISRLERGVGNPWFTTLMKISTALNVSLPKLTRFNDNKTKKT